MGDPLALLLELRVPQLGEHGVPFTVTVQVTPLFVPSLLTVAVNCWAALIATLAEGGDTNKEMGSIFMEAFPVAALLVTDAA